MTTQLTRSAHRAAGRTVATGNPRPGRSTVDGAITLAACAPSLRPTPCRWLVTDDGLELFASRPSGVTRLEDRDLLISCGIALHHLRAALAAFGWATDVRRFPDPGHPEHLATLHPRVHSPTDDDMALAAAITRRLEGAVPDSCSVSDDHVHALALQVARAGALLSPITGSGVDGGIEPADSAPQRVIRLPMPRSADHDAIVVPPTTATSTRSRWLTLATTDDNALARFSAGEALSSALLTATNLGLGAQLHPHVLPPPGEFAGGPTPQLVLRVGSLREEPVPPTFSRRRRRSEVRRHSGWRNRRPSAACW